MWLNLSGSGGGAEDHCPESRNRPWNVDLSNGLDRRVLVRDCRLSDVCKAIMAIISPPLQHEHASHLVDGSVEVRGSRK
jgi:hypothetical protein